MNQLLGEEHAPRLRDCDGRGAEVLFKKPAQLAFSHADTSPKGLDSSVLSIKKAFGNER